MSRVYAIASAKGGVGKTTTTANLGTVLSMAGHDVVVVDGDLGMPNLAGALGVDPDGETLHDVLTGSTTVESATYEGPEGLSVVPGSTALEAFASANAKELHPVIETLQENHDIVLIDTGAGLSDDTFVPLKLADEVLLVSTTEREALGDTEKTRQLGDRIGADIVGVVLTRVNQSNPNADVVAELLDTGVIAVVPEDAAIREALHTQTPVVARSPESIAAAGYRALAEALTGKPVPVPESQPDDAESTDEQSSSTPAADADDSETDDTRDGAETVVETDDTPDSDVTTDDASVDIDVPEEEPLDAEPDPEAVAEQTSESDTDPEPDQPQTPEAEANVDDEPEANAEDDSESVPEQVESAESEPIPQQGSTPEPDRSTASTPTPEERSTTEATLEDEAEAALDAAVPFGSGNGTGRAEAVDEDPLASDADDDELTADTAADDEDPVTADLDDADSMGADPLAGDAVVEATTSGSDTSVGDASVADDDSAADEDAASIEEDPETADSPETADETAEASAVIAEAPSESADEPLVAEAEPDAVAEERSDAGDDDEEGVYTTSLVEEVEALEDEGDDEEKSGFFRRFLG
ncbi:MULTISPECIES: MinD/ParA family protein [Haloferax]|uniref:AAA family ATPase n=2 Tax=Haloferax TaxID=2251 RepID=A0A6G1YYS3_9EURY|nr:MULTISPECIES: MinD/ParA family protein [Haloferax]KAB1186849.1 AAA family ATPase [Haloferax sp. CBA1149]MRW79479.1 AAA family ATPase [Haloferax marinisediminis]